MRITRLRSFWIYALSFLILAACLKAGFSFARQKPLWNDEVYSQIIIDQKSFGELFLAKNPEGNPFPLFYVIQKAVSWLFGYSIPPGWNVGDWETRDPYLEILLRIGPVVFTSLAIVAIFYYFARFDSLLVGAYSLVISFSSYMIWMHWAEARPYALWVFLTTVQMLIFLRIAEDQKARPDLWNWLVAIHLLLSTTIVFSIVQIAIISFLLFLLKERAWKKYLLMAALPIIIALIYSSQSPPHGFMLDRKPGQLIRECCSRERFYMVFTFTFFLGLYFFQKKTGFPRIFSDDAMRRGIPLLAATALIMLAAIGIMVLLWIRNNPEGFAVSNRYFIFLTPVGIISMTSLSALLIRSLKGQRVLQGLSLLGTGYWVLARLLKNTDYIAQFFKGIFS